MTENPVFRQWHTSPKKPPYFPGQKQSFSLTKLPFFAHLKAGAKIQAHFFYPIPPDFFTDSFLPIPLQKIRQAARPYCFKNSIFSAYAACRLLMFRFSIRETFSKIVLLKCIVPETAVHTSYHSSSVSTCPFSVSH